jgi:hypothetical protein
VTPDASPADLFPDASFLPPTLEWNQLPLDDLQSLNEGTRKPLCNGNLSPGVQTYRERQKELRIDNTAAFRTIRRIPAPAGETPARLGNAYEFYKNLEFFSGYWPDTSLPAEPEVDETISTHLQTHVRTGTGAQLPPDYRQNLLSAFIKLVAYDFGCNVSFPRTEPRLHLMPPPASTTATAAPSQSPPSYFNSSVTFIYRTPVARMTARAGIVEGPVAALSARSTTVFASPSDDILDLAREVVAVLLTAQQRAREGKEERRFGEGKWWTTKPRWGGGPGGPIGKEGDRVEALAGPEMTGQSMELSTSHGTAPSSSTSTATTPANTAKAGQESKVVTESKRQLSSITSPLPSSAGTSTSSKATSALGSSSSSSKRSKKDSTGQMAAYDLYRKLLPPSPTWDRKARYLAIGSIPSAAYDDIFLVSALNHHVSVVRARIPKSLLAVLDGGDVESVCAGSGEGRGWDKVAMWRSKWYDLFLIDERCEAMDLVWGMMGWLMRKIEAEPSSTVSSTPPPAAAPTNPAASTSTSHAEPKQQTTETETDRMDLS